MKIVVWSQPNCSGCVSAVKLLTGIGATYELKVIGQGATREEFNRATDSARTVPQIIVDGKLLGGVKELREFLSDQTKDINLV